MSHTPSRDVIAYKALNKVFYSNRNNTNQPQLAYFKHSTECEAPHEYIF